VSPVLLRLGSHTLYWYTALLAIGILSGASYVFWRSLGHGFRREHLTDASLWSLGIAVVGARLAYVIPNWEDYSGRSGALLGTWGGGLVFQGGLVAGTLALWFYANYRRLSFLRLADLAAPGVALAQALGWAGAHVHGAHYGRILRSPFSLWLPDLYGVYGPRVPTQLLASALGLTIFWGLHRLRKWRLSPGTLALLYFLVNGAGHFLLGFGRADSAACVGRLRVTQVADLLEALVAAALLVHCWLNGRRRTASRGHGTVEARGT
jgi:phosphatidylglycerol:prolipoprotein diacylglycerol transferase